MTPASKANLPAIPLHLTRPQKRKRRPKKSAISRSCSPLSLPPICSADPERGEDIDESTSPPDGPSVLSDLDRKAAALEDKIGALQTKSSLLEKETERLTLLVHYEVVLEMAVRTLPANVFADEPSKISGRPQRILRDLTSSLPTSVLLSTGLSEPSKDL